MPYSKTDLAYIAGLVDGEGYVGLVKTSEIRRRKKIKDNITHCFAPTVKINMTSRVAIQFIQSIFGGKIYFTPKPAPNRDVYDWQLTNKKDCKRVLEEILPFLRLKKRQAEILLDFIFLRESKPKTNSSGGTYTENEWKCWREIKKLNKKGC